MSKSIVISGATGCIGVSLVKYFKQKKCKILLILRPGSKRNKIFEDLNGIQIYYSELSAYSNIEINESYDIFYHFAWNGGKNRNDIDSNINSAKYSVDAVKLANRLKCTVFIGAGSQAECGIQEVPISDKTLCNPVNAFGIGKLLSYYLTRMVCFQNNIRHCWLRILSVYGPNDGNQTLVSSTILNLLNNNTLAFTDGEQKWDFIFSDDAAEIIGKIGINKKSEGIYVIGSGKAKKLKEFISIITKLFNINANPYFGLIPKSSVGVNYLKADTSRLVNEFNWAPKTSFLVGVKKTIAYLKN